MRRWFCVFLVVSLSGCGISDPQSQPDGGAPPEVFTPVTLTPAQVQAMRRDVRESMLDPESARFGSHGAARGDDGSITACGFVNGRNRFGGYVGMQPFIGMFVGGNRFAVVDIASSPAAVSATMTLCERRGIRP